MSGVRRRGAGDLNERSGHDGEGPLADEAGAAVVLDLAGGPLIGEFANGAPAGRLRVRRGEIDGDTPESEEPARIARPSALGAVGGVAVAVARDDVGRRDAIDAHRR